MKKIFISTLFCLLLGFIDKSASSIFAQESIDEPVIKPVKDSDKNQKVAAPMSDWVLSGSNIYNLSTYVGIGTSTPAYKLDILHSGSSGLQVQSSSGYSVIDIDAASGDAALRFQKAGVNQWNIRNDPSTNNLQIFELGGGGERFQIQNNTGFLGLNDVNPAARLSVGGKIKINDGTQALGRVLTSDANGLASWQANPTSPFLVSGGNIFYPAGNVGIGSSSPNGKLQFANAIANRTIVLYEETNNDHQYYGFGINSGILRYQVGTGGNHVFYATINGSTSKELFKIASNGNITAAGVINFTSDRRLKKDIVHIENVLPKLNSINGYNYYWIDKTNSTKRQIGLIAQEVEKIYPELVETNAEGYKSVNYVGLIPILLEGVKDLQKQLDNKTSDINQLKAEFEELKSQLKNLSVSNEKIVSVKK